CYGASHFDIAAGAHTIGYHHADEVPLHYLLERVVLPLYFMLTHDEWGLHASAVHLDARAWVFAGPAGAGKSTLAWRLLRHGARLSTDDLVLVDGQGRVRPAAGALRLDAAREQVDEAALDEDIGGVQGKRWYRLADVWQAPGVPAPLAAIYVLDAQGSEERRGGK